MSHFLKKSFIFIFYFITAGFACFFALLFVLNFVNPALSEEGQDTSQQQEQSGFKEDIGNIWGKFKTLIQKPFNKEKDIVQPDSGNNAGPGNLQVPEGTPIPAPVENASPGNLQVPEGAPIPAPIENVSPGNLQVPEGAPIPAPIENVSPGNLQVPDGVPLPAPIENVSPGNLQV
ncbi:MAG: hypothetical protein OXC37_03070, partial [Bdellovibrionaceae bacterium]|nr:hypothetical protein [Pseudobdellovibrionaceae bacterium]